jgi:hypothetical protein
VFSPPSLSVCRPDGADLGVSRFQHTHTKPPKKFFKKKLEYGREKKKQKIAVDHGDQEEKKPLAKIQAI